MEEKPIDWRGSSLRDIKDNDIFTPNARREAGRQLGQIQAGLEPVKKGVRNEHRDPIHAHYPHRR